MFARYYAIFFVDCFYTVKREILYAVLVYINIRLVIARGHGQLSAININIIDGRKLFNCNLVTRV